MKIVEMDAQKYEEFLTKLFYIGVANNTYECFMVEDFELRFADADPIGEEITVKFMNETYRSHNTRQQIKRLLGVLLMHGGSQNMSGAVSVLFDDFTLHVCMLPDGIQFFFNQLLSPDLMFKLSYLSEQS